VAKRRHIKPADERATQSNFQGTRSAGVRGKRVGGSGGNVSAYRRGRVGVSGETDRRVGEGRVGVGRLAFSVQRAVGLVGGGSVRTGASSLASHYTVNPKFLTRNTSRRPA
ncbi:MAG TPA: hypothetical protein VK775_23200, partial [Chthoniobacterales bacterium]|nr:hypothetical protein [Chthoniobacterales bacterium]